MIDEFLFFGSCEERKLCVCTFSRRNALFCKRLEDTANSCVCVLNIINRVLIVLTYCKVKVKVHLCVSLFGVKEEPCAVNRHFVKQIAELNGLAGTLAHFYKLTVLNKLNKLHKNNIELVTVIADSVHCAFHSHNMTVMVCSPNINKSCESTVKFVLVVCNVGCKICRIAVLTNENIVL